MVSFKDVQIICQCVHARFVEECVEKIVWMETGTDTGSGECQAKGGNDTELVVTTSTVSLLS